MKSIKAFLFGVVIGCIPLFVYTMEYEVMTYKPGLQVTPQSHLTESGVTSFDPNQIKKIQGKPQSEKIDYATFCSTNPSSEEIDNYIANNMDNNINKLSPVYGVKKTLLYTAVQSKNTQLVQALLSKNGLQVDLGQTQPTANTPLLLAVEMGLLDIVTLLCKNGANKEAKDKDGDTALVLALRMKRPDIAKYLINNGSDCKALDKQQRTPLHIAAKEDLIEVVQALITKKVEINQFDETGNTPLHLAAAHNSDIDLVKLLIQNGANVNAHKPNKPHWTPLYAGLSSRASNNDLILALLNAGARADLPHSDGYTPLYIAAEMGYSDQIIQALIKSGADVNYTIEQDEPEKTPEGVLLRETMNPWFGKYLIKGGGKRENLNGLVPYLGGYLQKFTILHMAVDRGHSSVVETLLKFGADIEAKDSDGNTPLMTAILAPLGRSFVEKLLDKGANKNEKNNKNEKPIDIAHRIGLERIQKLLNSVQASLTGNVHQPTQIKPEKPLTLNTKLKSLKGKKQEIQPVKNKKTPLEKSLSGLNKKLKSLKEKLRELSAQLGLLKQKMNV